MSECRPGRPSILRASILFPAVYPAPPCLARLEGLPCNTDTILEQIAKQAQAQAQARAQTQTQTQAQAQPLAQAGTGTGTGTGDDGETGTLYDM